MASGGQIDRAGSRNAIWRNAGVSVSGQPRIQAVDPDSPEREVTAHLAVARALAGVGSPEFSCERLLSALTTALNFSIGALWLPSGDVLVLHLFCTVEARKAPAFESASRQLRLPIGVGIPGLAWERRGPVDIAGVAEHTRFVRSKEAAQDGLSCGVAIPAIAGEEILAVFEFWSREETEVSDRLMLLLTGVGYELGTAFAHRRAQLSPPPLTYRQLEILRRAAQGLSARAIAAQLSISPATVKSHFEHIYERLGVSGRTSAVAQALRNGLIE